MIREWWRARRILEMRQKLAELELWREYYAERGFNWQEELVQTKIQIARLLIRLEALMGKPANAE